MVDVYKRQTYDRETHFIPNGVNRPEIREAKLITDKFGLKKDSYISVSYTHLDVYKRQGNMFVRAAYMRLLHRILL